LRLTSLLEESDRTGAAAGADIEITGLSADSRKVRPGYLFAALPGSQHDGRKFIAQAIDAGAVAVLGPPDLQKDIDTPDIRFITDAKPRRRLARMAAQFYGGQPDTIAAVTGTNGKTSVAHFARQMWTEDGTPAASLGTLGLLGPGLDGGASLTTPDPVDLHQTLADLKTRGIDHLVLEASSHGLAQYRLDGVRLSAAAFTNLSRDHLDYHGDEASYRQSKQRLFAELLPERAAAILNNDSPEYGALREIAKTRKHRVLTYGMTSGDICCVEAAPSDEGWRLTLCVQGETFETAFPLPGAFQIANMLCALGLVIACGTAAAALIPQIATLDGVPGRLERVAQRDNGGVILVDYAHTPDALRTVLTAVRAHVKNRLLVVFGCGGDRDAGKRPQMGKIAAEHADLVFVTDDNPRGESAAAIRAEVMLGCPDAREIGDRRDAVTAAIGAMAEGDILVVAGKGHEQGQIVGDTVLPFDDAAVIRDIVRSIA
jgi:UDP-N-acetylmuramoyl-L-alanyl-D-glutamate--2,6-diaminopimelate ligase